MSLRETASTCYAYISLKAFTITERKRRLFQSILLLLLGLHILRVTDIVNISDVAYVREALGLFIFTIAGYLFFSLIRFGIVSKHRNRRGISGEEKDNFTTAADAIVVTLTGLLGVVWTFYIYQIEFHSFLTSIALFSVALAMITQDFIKNFVYGLLLMFSDDYQIGHYVQIGTYPKGVIQDITLSVTKLRTDDGNLLCIPNQVARTSNVVNLSKTKHKKIRVTFAVSPSKITDSEEFKRRILNHLEAVFSDGIQKDSSSIHIVEMSGESITFELEVSFVAYGFNIEHKVRDSVFSFVLEYTK